MRYLYIIKDPISKEVVWVGETSKPQQRYDQHAWGTTYDSKEKKEWLIGLKAIGLKPLFEIVDTTKTKREAIIKENHLIVSYLKKGCRLFNIKNSKTIKQYTLSGVLINEFADGKMVKEITGFRGHVGRPTSGGFQFSYGDFNPDLIAKNKAAKEVLCRPVVQINTTGKVISEFIGVREASRKTGIDHRSIQSVAAKSNPKRHTAGGYKWEYKNE